MWSRLASLFLFAAILSAAPPTTRTMPSGWPWDVIPHVVDGGSWSTTLILVNISDKSSQYKLDFRGDDGKPLKLELAGRGSLSTISGVLPVQGAITFQTSGTAEALTQGWASLDPDKTDWVALMAIFRQRVPGRPDYEATVPASTSVDTNSILPFDNTSGYVTSIAILNPIDLFTSVVPIDIFDETGNRIATETLRIPQGNKIAFATSERWPALAGKKGTIQFLDGLYGLSVLGFRFGPTGAFTTLPVMDRLMSDTSVTAGSQAGKTNSR